VIRRENDLYHTPHVEWVVEQLTSRVPITGTVLDPCRGKGGMEDCFTRYGLETVGTDLIQGEHFDSGSREYWQWAGRTYDWIITNPPFSEAFRILKNCLPHARLGIAFLLRSTWDEPTIERGWWLSQNPPTRRIVLPRMRFTGDGSDTATVVWMVWQRGVKGTIEVVPRDPRIFPSKKGKKS